MAFVARSRYKKPVRLGTLMLQLESWSAARRQYLQAEQVGFDIAYAADHLSRPSIAGAWFADGFATLAAAAEATTRIGLGTLVASAAIRNPLALLRVAATVQDVSGGRFVLGIGAGAASDVVADRGVDVSNGELAARYAEVVDAVVALRDGASSWQGDHVGARDVQTRNEPPGLTPIPLLLAAHGPRGYQVVARHATTWNTFGGEHAAGLPFTEFLAAVTQQRHDVLRVCEQFGRDPLSLQTSVVFGYGAHHPLESAAVFAETVERVCAAGFDELVTYWPQGQPGGRFWADTDTIAEGIRAARETVTS